MEASPPACSGLAFRLPAVKPGDEKPRAVASVCFKLTGEHELANNENAAAIKQATATAKAKKVPYQQPALETGPQLIDDHAKLLFWGEVTTDIAQLRTLGLAGAAWR